MNLLKTTASVTAFALAMVFAGGASAQECERGDLDKRYCDTDGDLIADIPTDASKWIGNPPEN